MSLGFRIENSKTRCSRTSYFLCQIRVNVVSGMSALRYTYMKYRTCSGNRDLTTFKVGFKGPGLRVKVQGLVLRASGTPTQNPKGHGQEEVEKVT